MPAHKQRNQLPQRYQIAGFACPHQAVQISLEKLTLLLAETSLFLRNSRGCQAPTMLGVVRKKIFTH
jgi:hypothetical protein